MDSEDLARRLRAARAITPPTNAELDARPTAKRKPEPGITVAELADRINEAGLGERTLGKIERAEKTPANRDLLAIAGALGLSLDFFVLEREALLRRLAGDGAPGIPGATGRRLLDQRPSAGDRPQSETDVGEDRKREAGE